MSKIWNQQYSNYSFCQHMTLNSAHSKFFMLMLGYNLSICYFVRERLVVFRNASIKHFGLKGCHIIYLSSIYGKHEKVNINFCCVISFSEINYGWHETTKSLNCFMLHEVSSTRWVALDFQRLSIQNLLSLIIHSNKHEIYFTWSIEIRL